MPRVAVHIGDHDGVRTTTTTTTTTTSKATPLGALGTDALATTASSS
jgi:hypothetical protein